MPTLPPSTDKVRNGESMNAVVRSTNAALMAGHDFLHALAGRLHQAIHAKMMSEGLDGHGRFGMGSDAKRAADSVCIPIQKAGDNLMAAQKLLVKAGQNFDANVVQPIKRARYEREHNRGNSELDI